MLRKPPGAGGWVLLAALVLLQGCAGLTERRALRDTLVQKAGWSSHVITTRQFDIAASAPAARRGDVLVAYLEGDGRAYIDASLASDDPTPRDPLALRMALADPREGPVLYLARPCQYALPADGRNCSQRYWTGQRYAPAIVDSLSEALDQEKQRTGASTLLLMGYSGGGALAALLAQRRPDVAGIVTVAANLDLAYWTTRDRLAALEGSLDPATLAPVLRGLPQLHLAGAEDHVVGPDVTRAFLQRMDAGASPVLRVLPGFDHVCCWAEQWPSLLQRTEVRRVLSARTPHSLRGAGR